jgi:hypothetical protein
MSALQPQLPEQLSLEMNPEMNPMKNRIALDELCHAVDIEREENRLCRSGCREDCREHGEHIHLPRSPLPSTGTFLFLEWMQFPQPA